MVLKILLFLTLQSCSICKRKKISRLAYFLGLKFKNLLFYKFLIANGIAVFYLNNISSHR